MGGHRKISFYLGLFFGLLFIVTAALAVLLVNRNMREQALIEAASKSRLMLDQNLAIHTYFSKDLKPSLFQTFGPLKSHDYFDPNWMSSTYAVGKIEKYFHHFNSEPYQYKECSIDARSPQNEADDYEKQFLKDLGSDPKLTERVATRMFNGEPYFTLLRRGEEMDESCLRCHSTPEKAPGDLVRQYGPERSFNRRVGDVVQAISMTVPLAAAFSNANRLSVELSSLLVGILAGAFLLILFFIKRLVVSPLTAVSGKASLIASSPEHLGEEIEPPKVRELNSLVAAFNHMSLELKHTHDNLEERVKDRTSQLDDANSVLTAEIEERNKIEQDLTEQKELLQTILDNIPVMVALFESHGRLQWVNQCWQKTLGWSLQEAQTTDILSEVYPDPGYREQVQDFITTHKETWGDFEGITRNGDPIHMSWINVPLSDGSVIGLGLDVTRQKQTQEAIKVSEATLRSVLEQMPSGVSIRDAKTGDVILSNTRLRQMIHHPLPVGQGEFDEYGGFYYPDGRQYRMEDLPIFRSMSSGETVDSEEIEFLSHHGIAGALSVSSGPIRDSRGQIVSGIAVVHDITERKRAEQARREAQEALRHSEAKYRSLFEDSLDGIYVTTADGILQDANQSYLDLFGYRREEIVGTSVLKLYADPGDRKKLLEQIEERFFVKDSPMKLVKKDGTVIDCLVSAKMQQAHNGTTQEYRGIVRDVTERRALQNQLFQAQKMEAVGTLAAGVAHDFNNLLQVVSGYTELLMRDGKGTPRQRDLLEKIHQTSARGADLVKNLMIFSRKIEPKVHPLILNDEIVQVQKFLTRTIPKTIKIDLHLSGDLDPIQADTTQMGQILMNLGVNARDAMPEGGTLTFETTNVELDEVYCASHLGFKPGRYVRLTVSDTGSGMSQETLDHIFEPFFTTKEIGKGTGLGLSTVYGIVKEHEGHITCYSELDIGTTFKIYLPAIGREAELETRAVQTPVRGGTETILLVDDEELLRDLGAEILTHWGYQVLTAEDGRLALDIYQEKGKQISLVILDLIMPVMDGKQCLAEIVRINPDAKVIIASGYSEDGPLPKGDLRGTKGFVEKPYRSNSLLQLVREVLDGG